MLCTKMKQENTDEIRGLQRRDQLWPDPKDTEVQISHMIHESQNAL